MKGNPKQLGRAFSLLELLVAIVLLAILGVLMAQITGSITSATRLSNQGVDAAAQARIAFDRIGMDLNSAVLRPDADFQAASTNTAAGNFLSFFSTIASADPIPAPSGFTNRRISLVAYRTGPSTENSNRVCLLRAAKAIGWNEAGFMGIQTNGMAANGTVTNNVSVPLFGAGFPLTLANADFDILAPAVIHSVAGFQLYPDNQPATLQDGTTVAQARGQIVYSPPVTAAANAGDIRLDPTRIGAIVVGLVVIDPEKLKLLDAASVNLLSAAFANPPAQDQLPVAKWMADTANLVDLPATVPIPIRQSVRVYQRFFPLGSPDQHLP